MVLDAPKHYPVLLSELISIISPQHGGTFIDCTFGQGGCTQKILSYKNTNVIALDRDIKSKIKAVLSPEYIMKKEDNNKSNTNDNFDNFDLKKSLFKKTKKQNIGNILTI